MRWLLALAMLLAGVMGSAQPSAVRWYFGRYAGIDFGTGCQATQILTSAMHAREGCATATDDQGRLIAYSNGETVWNRFHRPMPNGRSLRGHVSSSQSALFVPWPGRPDSLLLFTTDAAEANGQNGLRAVVISRRADRGAGDVVGEEIVLHAPTTERLVAVAPCHRRWYWLISREYGSNRFLCYRIDHQGLHREPVVSAAGLEPGGLSTHVLGCLAASPDGRHLALAHQSLNRIELFDFDPETGRVSRPRLVGQVAAAYGVAFSPNGQLLYATTRYGQGSAGVSLVQFRLDASDATGTYPAHRIQIRDTAFAGLGDIQLGPDLQLYVARFNNEYLGLIRHPDRVGEACGFASQGFYLGGRHSAFGLPNQPVVANAGCERIWTCDSLYCEGDTARLNACTLPNARWQWFRDGRPIVGAMSSELLTTESGRFTVQVVSGGCAWIAGPVDIRRVPVDRQLSGDSVLCPGESLVLRAGGNHPTDARFEWRRNGNNIPDASESSYEPRFPGRYSVRISSRACSFETQEVRIRAVEEFATIAGDSLLCSGGGGVLLETPAHPDFRYRWLRDGQPLPDADGPLCLADAPGLYRVEAIYRSCTTLSPPFDLRILRGKAQLTGRLWLCPRADSARLRVDCPLPIDRVYWLADGHHVGTSQGPVWLAHRAGRWQAVAVVAGCPDTTAPIDVGWLPAAAARIEVDPPSDRPRPAHEPVRLTAHVTGCRPLYWIIEGPDGHVRHAGTPLEHRFPGAGRYGVRLVAASDSGCPAEARLELTFEAVPIENWLDLPNAFTPNGDGTNEVYTFSVNQLRAWRFSVYDRWNNLAYEVDAPALPAWDGQLRWGGTAPEGVYIYRLTGETHGGETVRRTGSIHVVR